MSVWKISRDRSYATNVDLWLDESCAIPGIKCDVCQVVWTICQQNRLITIPTEVRFVISKLKRPISREDLDRVRNLFGKDGDHLFPGVCLGPATVRKLRGKIVHEFAWSAATAILSENDFERLQGMVGGVLKGCSVANQKGHPPLVELVSIPLRLRQLYPKTRCDACDCPDTSMICKGELEEIYRLADSSSSLYSVPGGLVCGDSLKCAIEALGIRNCTFSEWSVEKVKGQAPNGPSI